MTSALDEARSFFEGTTERPLDYVEALAWDLLAQLRAVEQERDEWKRVAENLARDPEDEDA